MSDPISISFKTRRWSTTWYVIPSNVRPTDEHKTRTKRKCYNFHGLLKKKQCVHWLTDETVNRCDFMEFLHSNKRISDCYFFNAYNILVVLSLRILIHGLTDLIIIVIQIIKKNYVYKLSRKFVHSLSFIFIYFTSNEEICTIIIQSNDGFLWMLCACWSLSSQVPNKLVFAYVSDCRTTWNLTHWLGTSYSPGLFTIWSWGSILQLYFHVEREIFVFFDFLRCEGDRIVLWFINGIALSTHPFCELS